MTGLRYTWIVLLVWCSNGLFAQKTEEAFYQTDTLRKLKSMRVIGLPVIFYTPETQLGIGGGGQFFFPRQSNIYNDRVSNMLFTAVYTTQGQFLLDGRPQIFFQKGDYFLDSRFRYRIFPNTFWGVGSDTPDSNEEEYNMRSIELNVAFLKRLPPDLNFGFEFIHSDHKILEVADGGLLEADAIPGSQGAVVTGLGVIFNLDNRDDVFSSSNGFFVQLNARFSSQNLGATASFNKFVTDLRYFKDLKGGRILGFQLFSENNFGEVPFQGKTWFGGSQLGRGYFRGRFIDNHMYVFQSEYRWNFHPRWGTAGFISVGEVADQPSDFFSDLRPSFGGGIRFKLKKDSPTLLRLDVGIGTEGNRGFYFAVNEAF